MSAGVKALRAVRQLERNKEKKEFEDNDSDQIPIAGAGQVQGVGPYMQQGDSNITRTGNRITIKSISCRLRIDLTALEALGTSVRVMLVYDRRPNGANAGFTDVLETDSILSPLNIKGNSRGRFQVVFDRTIDFTSTQAHWSDNFWKRMNLQVNYDGNAGTVADVDRGNFMMLTCAAGNAAAINVNWYIRMAFEDD